jgi:hypothetical protein
MSIPQLEWLNGKISEILIQDKEQFYVITIYDGSKNHSLRFGDPHTGDPIQITADNPAYALLLEAFFRDHPLQVGVRDFGYDPQSGIEKIVIDRISVTR